MGERLGGGPAVEAGNAAPTPTYDPVGMHPSCWKRPSRSSSTQSSISLPPAKRPMMMTVHVALRPDAAIPCHSPFWVACQRPRQTPRSSATDASVVGEEHVVQGVVLQLSLRVGFALMALPVTV